MRLIINLFVLLSYCLVHGLVIPRQELTSLDDLDGLDILPCDALNSCPETIDYPSINIPDNSPLPAPGTEVVNPEGFITEYVDASGNTRPLEVNPTYLKLDFLSQLRGPTPYLLNDSLQDQLNNDLSVHTPEIPQAIPPTNSIQPPNSFQFLDDSDLLAQAETDSPLIDDIWHV